MSEAGNQIGSMARRLWMIVWLSLLLGACSDPGSGGTGIPGTAASPAPVGGNDSAAPDVGASCSTPGANSETFTGVIQSLNGDCLVVGERSIRIDTALILRRSGASANRNDLLPGTRVIVEPLTEDPSRARQVTIDDLI